MAGAGGVSKVMQGKGGLQRQGEGKWWLCMARQGKGRQGNESLTRRKGMAGPGQISKEVKVGGG